MIQIQDIHSLTDFQRNVKEHIDHLRKTGRPEVLTINGKAAVVVQDAKAYQDVFKHIDYMEAVKGIKAGLDSMKRGAGRPAKEVFKKIREKHKIPHKL